MNQPKLYTVPETALMLSVDRSQVYVLINTEQLGWTDVGTGKRPRVRIPEFEIDRFIKRRTRLPKRAVAA